MTLRLDTTQEALDLGDKAAFFPTFIWYETGATLAVRGGSGWSRLPEVREGDLGCGGRALLPHMAHRRRHPPRKCGGDVPTGEEAAPCSWPSWGQLAAGESPREERKTPFSTHFFPLPQGYSGKEGM